VAQEAPVASPETAPLIQRSFEHYTAGDFGLSVEAASEALKLDPASAIAYNNICAAQIRRERYDEAIEACNKALEIAPEYALAWGNLRWAYDEAPQKAPSVDVFLGLSVLRYWEGEIEQSLDASRKVLELDPANALAYNNICAAHALRGEWEPAIAACEKALALDPDFERARNNLEWARSERAGL
jgi:tetratricopeptide (TPR) repeat protein